MPDADPLDDTLLRAVPVSEGRRLLDGRYALEAQLGRGGMGVVYRGLDTRLQRPVAVKCLLPHAVLDDGSTEQRFLREARLAAALEHPNLVRVHDVGQDPDSGLDFLVMELVEGWNAQEVVQAGGPMALERALEVARDGAAGLAALHGAGLVHRDLKPDNLLITTGGDTKLSDLGLAKPLDEVGLTATGVGMGTPRTMAPEQFGDARGVTSAADVYGLGATLYFLLVGEHGLGGSTIFEIKDRVEQEPFPRVSARRPDVPAALDELIAECTEKDPGARPADGRALLERLQALGEMPAGAVDSGGLTHQRLVPAAEGSQTLARLPEGAAEDVLEPTASGGSALPWLAGLALVGALGWGGWQLWGAASEEPAGTPTGSGEAPETVDDGAGAGAVTEPSIEDDLAAGEPAAPAEDSLGEPADAGRDAQHEAETAAAAEPSFEDLAVYAPDEFLEPEPDDDLELLEPLLELPDEDTTGSGHGEAPDPGDPGETAVAEATRLYAADALRRWTADQPPPELAGLVAQGRNAQGLPEYTLELPVHEAVTLGSGPAPVMRFVLIPAGSFRMGAPPSEAGRRDHEGPRHEAAVEAFLMAVTECTVEQYLVLLGERPVYPQYEAYDVEGREADDLQLPAFVVRWDQAMTLAGSLGARLPTEVEWEYAARAGEEGPLYGPLDEIACHNDNLMYYLITTVGQRQANGFGLKDVIGSVAEWCAQGPWPYPDQETEDLGSWIASHEDKSRRVLRGGGGYDRPDALRLASRGVVPVDQDTPDELVGVRLVLPFPDAPSPTPERRGGGVAEPDDGFDGALLELVEDERWRRVGRDASGVVEYELTLPGGVAMRFVEVRVANWILGSPPEEPGRTSAEGPLHLVELEPFLMARTECTRAQWRAVMGSVPGAGASEHLPVTGVSWFGVQEFEKRSGLTLPSEAEWEAACRAGTKAARPGPLDAIAWHAGNAGGRVRPVAGRAANRLGLFDMLGNAAEWCEDTWHGDYQDAPYDGSAWVTGDAGWRLVRGGSAFSDADACRSAARQRTAASTRRDDLGFRPILRLR